MVKVRVMRRRWGRAGRNVTTAAALEVAPSGRLALASAFPSPLTVESLDPAMAVAFGLTPDGDSVTRREAMRIPAVRRGRSIIAGTIGAMTWQTRRGGEYLARPLVDQPDPDTTPQWVWTWLVDDLLFHGVAWWRVTERELDGYPRRAERVTRDRIFLEYGTDAAGRQVARAYIDGAYVPPQDLIRFDGPDEGLLEYGATTLRTCLLLERAVRRFAALDVPLGYLAPVEGSPELSSIPGTAEDGSGRSQVDALLDEWEAARARRTTAYLNGAIKYETVMFDAQRVQLSEARQYQAAEVARLVNLPPRYVNAPQASGMTYSSTESDRRDLLDTTLNQYLIAIGQRLSMPDVTPRGQTVAPDVRSFLRGDMATVLAAGEVAIRTGVADPAEVRNEWLGLSGPPPPTPPTIGDTAP